MFDKLEFGKRLYYARRAMGYKQMDVASRLGIVQSAYSDIENGKKDVSATILCDLADILKVSTNYLLHGIDIDLPISEQYKIDEYKRFLLTIRPDNNIFD